MTRRFEASAEVRQHARALHAVHADAKANAPRLVELEHRAALIAQQIARLWERPIFALDDITELQIAQLEKRVRRMRADMDATRAAQRQSDAEGE